MKRSKMIKKIRERLVGVAITGPTIDVLSPEFPEQILMFIEELGMRPPVIRVKDPGHFPGDYFYYDAHEWEPENE